VNQRAARVGYQEVREYLKHRGWVAVPSRRTYAAVFRSPGAGDFEVQVPLERDLADYADAMESIAQRAAAFEGRSPDAVLHDFLQPRKDILRYALVGQSTADGTIGLVDGLAMLSGAKKSLLASACSVRRPARFHKRLALGEADAFVHACHLGQTEVGSFVLTVETPLEAGTIGASFGRRTTEFLLSSVSRLATTIRQDTVTQLIDAQAPTISGNLCEALLELMPSDESADLRLSSTWSPSQPKTDGTPSEAKIDRDMYESIELIAQKLRPSDDPIPDMFIGYVTELAGGFSPEGDVKLRIIVDEEFVEARAFLSRADYTKAGDAHLKEQTIAVRGVFHRGRRNHQIKDITSFEFLNIEPNV
jgi:hypothetical protein